MQTGLLKHKGSGVSNPDFYAYSISVFPNQFRTLKKNESQRSRRQVFEREKRRITFVTKALANLYIWVDTR